MCLRTAESARPADSDDAEGVCADCVVVVLRSHLRGLQPHWLQHPGRRPPTGFCDAVRDRHHLLPPPVLFDPPTHSVQSELSLWHQAARPIQKCGQPLRHHRHQKPQTHSDHHPIQK